MGDEPEDVPEPKRKVFIQAVSGYIGGNLAKRFAKEGFEVLGTLKAPSDPKPLAVTTVVEPTDAAVTAAFRECELTVLDCLGDCEAAEKLLAAIRKKMAPREPPVAAQAPTPVVPEVTQSAQNPAASPSKVHGPVKKDYSRLGAEEWAAMSLEEQEEAMRQVNAELDDEMGEEPDWDNSALKALGARN